MIIWIGLLSLSADINSTSDIIRRGLTAIGSQQQKVDGHTSAMSWDVRRKLGMASCAPCLIIDLESIDSVTTPG